MEGGPECHKPYSAVHQQCKNSTQPASHLKVVANVIEKVGCPWGKAAAGLIPIVYAQATKPTVSKLPIHDVDAEIVLLRGVGPDSGTCSGMYHSQQSLVTAPFSDDADARWRLLCTASSVVCDCVRQAVSKRGNCYNKQLQQQAGIP